MCLFMETFTEEPQIELDENIDAGESKRKDRKTNAAYSI
jgi:hypothetical protein